MLLEVYDVSMYIHVYNTISSFPPSLFSTDSCVALPQKCSLDLLASHFLPMCVGLGERAVALWHAEQLITTHITTSSTTGIEGYVEELVKVGVHIHVLTYERIVTFY